MKNIKWLKDRRIKYFEETQQLLDHARHNKMPLTADHVRCIETGKAALVPCGAVLSYMLLLGLDLKIIEPK